MNKRQLIAAAARQAPLTQRQMGQALDALLETIAGALAEGETVVLADFGRCLVQDYAGRRLRSFDGDGHFFVEDHQVPVFKPSAVLRRRVREGET